MKKLHVFDFDGTLMDSPLPDHGKLLYQQLTGELYPHKGWWGRLESLDERFDIKPIESVYAVFKAVHADPNAVALLVTNRMKKFEPLVLHHLNRHQIIMQHFNYADSFPYRLTKPQRVMKLLPYLEVSEITVYDDMQDQIDAYVSSAGEFDVPFTIMKVTETKELVKV